MTMKIRNWYLQRILLNFSGDNSTYLAVKEIVVDNLSSMGVEASMEDGMTTLAGKILDIEPTIVVDDFDIDLTLSANDTSVYVGDTVVLSAHLTASYDTEDVDLVGDLQNATVSFYENNTLLGTATTNSNGVATYNYTTLDDTDLIFSASFDGTENFDEATSNNVTVSVDEEEECFEMQYTGSSISKYGASYGFNGSNMKIDYGDGTIEATNGTDWEHTYTDGLTEHTIKIYGITSTNDYCFYYLSGITNVVIPSTFTSFGNFSFSYCDNLVSINIPSSVTHIRTTNFCNYCSNLSEVIFNWTDPSEGYRSADYTGTSSSLKFSIPYGTTSAYESAGYPSDKLVERSA